MTSQNTLQSLYNLYTLNNLTYLLSTFDTPSIQILEGQHKVLETYINKL